MFVPPGLVGGVSETGSVAGSSDPYLDPGNLCHGPGHSQKPVGPGIDGSASRASHPGYADPHSGCLGVSGPICLHGSFDWTVEDSAPGRTLLAGAEVAPPGI